jgi:hypothetical protein
MVLWSTKNYNEPVTFLSNLAYGGMHSRDGILERHF